MQKEKKKGKTHNSAMEAGHIGRRGNSGGMSYWQKKGASQGNAGVSASVLQMWQEPYGLLRYGNQDISSA